MLVLVALPAPTSCDSSESTTVVFSISGESQIDPGSHIWDSPIALSDSVYFDVAALLNSFAPETSTGRAVNATTTPQPAAEEGLAVWVIIVIAGGSCVLFVGLVVAIWFAVHRTARVHPGDGGNQARMGFSNRVYPPPHAYSKVIQVALVHHKLPSLGGVAP